MVFKVFIPGKDFQFEIPTDGSETSSFIEEIKFKPPAPIVEQRSETFAEKENPIAIEEDGSEIS